MTKILKLGKRVVCLTMVMLLMIACLPLSAFAATPNIVIVNSSVNGSGKGSNVIITKDEPEEPKVQAADDVDYAPVDEAATEATGDVAKITEVATYDELVEELANGGNIKLTADITVDTKITAIDGTTIDLNGNTLYVNVENSDYNNVTIKNGNIVLGKDDVHVCDGYFLVKEGKTLVVNGVKISSSAEGIKGYAVFHLKTGANLDLIGSELNISDNEYSAGYIVYAGESTATVDVVGTTVTASKVNGIVHAATVIKASAFTITNAIEHGINRSGVTITNSKVAISGGTGRGITAQNGPLVINGNSTVTIYAMGEATIELRNNNNMAVAETATVKLDVAVNNTTSGTVTGSVKVDTTLGAVAVIGDTGYKSFADALEAAKTMTGDVVIEIYDKVTLNSALSGSFDSIKFVGKDTDAEIYLDVQGYITATGKKVAFEDLVLSKSAGGHIANAGFMNVAFGIYDVTEVTYTNCNFVNGAYASSGKVAFNNCTFRRSHNKYGLWAYGNVDIIVDGCNFADYRGIKMYAEGGAKTVDLTVKNTNFSAVNNKPAIVLTYGESVTLEGNTYSSTGVFELDLDGAPNGTLVTSDVLPTCVNDNGACGVLVDGKIYTTVAQAAEVATSGSTVTLLHNSTETVEFAKGVILYKNGFTADSVTVKLPVYVAQIGDAKFETVAEALAAAQDGNTITLIWSEGDAPIAMNGAVYGKTVTITGTATVDWSKGFLFVGRGGEGNGTVIFDNANLTSASNSDSYGIHVSGREKNTNNKYDGTLTIKNSTIELDYLINRGAIEVDNSKLTVKNGFGIAGRPATETENAKAATATITIKNGSYVNVLNHNGMGVGMAATVKEGYGILNLIDSTFECNNFDVDSELGDFNVSGTSTVKINKLTGKNIDIEAGTTLKDSTIGGSINMLGNLTIKDGLTLTGDLWVGKKGETLTATLEGDKLTANYFMFQHGSYTINADIEAVYGFLSFNGTFTVNSKIHTTGTNGEVLYINGNVTLNTGAVLDSDNSVFLSDSNAVLTIKSGAKIESNLNITKTNAKLKIDITGMTAGNYAAITGTVTNNNGTIEVINNDKLEAKIVDGKIVLSAKPVAQIGDVYYTDLHEAMVACKPGETVLLLADVTENLFCVPEGVTLDLNGHYITAATAVLAYGSIIDTATTTGGIKIGSDKIVHLQPENAGYMPLYDTRDGANCYRFYTYEVKTLWQDSDVDNTTKFGARVTFDKQEAYELLAVGGTKATIKISFTWEGKACPMVFTFSESLLQGYGESACDKLSSQKNMTATLVVTLSGLQSIAGKTIEASTIVESTTAVSGIAASKTFTVPVVEQ